MDDQSLEHSRWNCKYHIVHAPKFRHKTIYGKYKKEIGQILRRSCEYKKIEILGVDACVDHVHMCIKCLPSIAWHNHGILEEKKRVNDIRAVFELEI